MSSDELRKTQTLRSVKKKKRKGRLHWQLRLIGSTLPSACESEEPLPLLLPLPFLRPSPVPASRGPRRLARGRPPTRHRTTRASLSLSSYSTCLKLLPPTRQRTHARTKQAWDAGRRPRRLRGSRRLTRGRGGRSARWGPRQNRGQIAAGTGLPEKPPT